MINRRINNDKCFQDWGNQAMDENHDVKLESDSDSEWEYQILTKSVQVQTKIKGTRLLQMKNKLKMTQELYQLVNQENGDMRVQIEELNKKIYEMGQKGLQDITNTRDIDDIGLNIVVKS